MALENQRLKQIKTQYLHADFEFRCERLPRREFNAIIVETLTSLLEAFDEVEPYYSQFRGEAFENWIKANKLNDKKNPLAADLPTEQKVLTTNKATQAAIEKNGMNEPLRKVMGVDIP